VKKYVKLLKGKGIESDVVLLFNFVSAWCTQQY